MKMKITEVSSHPMGHLGDCTHIYVKVAVTPQLIQECIIYITFKNSLKMQKLIFILYI